MINDKKNYSSYLLAPMTILWISALLVVLALFLFMGMQPLFLEEPRRSFIAIEMLYNQNLWVPTQLGQLYYNKPPLFNWVLMVSAFFSGGFSEWAMRLPTVLSTLGIALVIYFMGRKYLDAQKGLEIGLLSITSAGIFFYFSTLAEIDLFYSLITLGVFFAIFHFDQIKKPYWLFLIVYFLTALGFLTKALPSLVFTALSLLTYFIYTKRFKVLLSLPHFVGIALFFLLSGAYYYQYAQYEDPSPFLNRLIGESSNRTVAGSGIGQFFKHLWEFPLNTLVDLLPGGLLLIFLFGKKFQEILKSNDFVKYCFWIGLINFLVYFISPGSRQRYIYMLYPLFMVLLVQAYYLTPDQQHWSRRFFRIFLLVLCILLGVGCVAINFIPDLDFLGYRVYLSLAGVLMFGLLFFFHLKRLLPELSTLIIATALTRLVFDLAIIPQRAHDSDAQKAKDVAYQIEELSQENPLYLYWPHQTTIINEYDISFITVYYLDVLREIPLRYQADRDKEGVFIVKKADLNEPYDLLMEFEQRGHQFALVRFK